MNILFRDLLVGCEDEFYCYNHIGIPIHRVEIRFVRYCKWIFIL